MSDRLAGEAFAAQQRAYFTEANAARFHWQTRTPYVADRERALLPRIEVEAANPFLEVGCGEGANLFHLTQARGAADKTIWVGADLFFNRVRYAARYAGPIRGVCADGLCLPFPDRRFHHVLARDIFHHVLEKDRLMGELRRVCAPRGTISIIEGNGRNPIVWLFGMLRRAERGQSAMRPEVILPLLGAGSKAASVEFLDPFPLYRVLFHYQFGFPGLAHHAWACRALTAVQGWVGRLLPRRRWGYFRVTFQVPPAAAD